MGAILANGNLYCPATPSVLLELSPLARGAGEAETAAHDQKAAELARRKLGSLSGRDADGYHRVGCPAARGKLRCPLRAASMALPHTRPEVLSPPEHPPTCCSQRTITVPAQVNAKTAQKHDYPSVRGSAGPAQRAALRVGDLPRMPIDSERVATAQVAALGAKLSFSPAFRHDCTPPMTSAASRPKHRNVAAAKLD